MRRDKLKSSKLCLLMVLLSWVQLSFAQEQRAFISELVESAGKPEEVIFIVLADGKFYRLEGEILRTPQEGRYLIGTSLPSLGSEISYSAILIPQAGEFTLLPQRRFSAADAHTHESLRSKIIEQREQLKQLAQEDSQQQQILKQLRYEAEIIGGLGRIVDLKEEQKRVKLDSEALDRDIQSLQKLLSITKTIAQPRNFSKREIDLTRSVAELAAKARAVERANFEPGLQSDTDLRRRMALLSSSNLNSSNFEQLDRLEREHERLSSLVKQLEARYPDVPSIDNAQAAMPD